MEPANNLNEILLSYMWQENLNAWTFREQVILIKNYSTPNSTKVIEYSIEKAADGKFILKTRPEYFGDLILTVNRENHLPKIILQSTIDKTTSYELQAFNSFTPEQKLMIRNKVKVLRTIFESKRSEVDQLILRLEKTSKGDKKTLVNQYKSTVHKTEEKIKMLETVVHSTIHVASNFPAYQERITSDITDLEEEISNIS